MPNPYLARSLVTARTQLNVRWPNRDRTLDGWIGDAAHQARKSDHNPDSRGIVHAIDVDKDGIHVPTVLAAFMLHPSTRYIIFNRRAFRSVDRYAPRAYTGENPHTGHIHLSIQYTVAAENSAVAWNFIPKNPVWLEMRQGRKTEQVRQLQAYLNGHGYSLTLDADFGPATDRAVRSFQAKHKLKVDGIVGPNTRKALFTK